VAHLFQRTKNTATTIPTINRQNGKTMDKASTVLRFSTPCALFSLGLAVFLTGSPLFGAVNVVLDASELPFVGGIIVELSGLFVF